MLKIDPYDLKQACAANKQMANICRDQKFKDQYDDIWFGRLKKDYASNPSLGLHRAAQYNYPQLFPYFLDLGANPLEIYSGLAIGKHYDLLDKIIKDPILNTNFKDMRNFYSSEGFRNEKKLKKHVDMLINQDVIGALGENADLKTLEKYPKYVDLIPMFTILYNGNDKLLKDILNSNNQKLQDNFFNNGPNQFYALLDTYPQFKPLEKKFDEIYRNSREYDAANIEDMRRLNPLHKYVKNQDLEAIKSFLENSESPGGDGEVVSWFVNDVVDHPLEIIKILLPYIGDFKEDLYDMFSRDKDVSNYIKNYVENNDSAVYNKIKNISTDIRHWPADIKKLKSAFNL